MLINFSHELYGLKASCDVVSGDGFEIENLISADGRKRVNGFLAARFIKPPVHILVEFPFPFHLHSVIINPKVGGQCTSDVDVLVASVPLRPVKRDDGSLGFVTDSGRNFISDVVINPQTAKNQHNHLFKLVGKGHFVDNKWLKFFNRFYQERPPVLEAVPQSCQTNMNQIELWSTNMVNNISHLLIRIPRMANSGVPALGQLDIWGQPARTCPKFVLQNVLKIHEKIRNIALIRSGKHFQKSSDSQISRKNLSLESTKKIAQDKKNGSDTMMEKNMDFDKIPQEFIDPLTCSIMSLPVLLPCGQNIDNSTLVKYNENEKLWGRSESDPFTGVPLSDVHRVVVNSNLKARIDTFLLSGVIDTRNLPRTLGSRQTESLKIPFTRNMDAASQNTRECHDTKINNNRQKTLKKDALDNTVLADELSFADVESNHTVSKDTGHNAAEDVCNRRVLIKNHDKSETNTHLSLRVAKIQNLTDDPIDKRNVDYSVIKKLSSTQKPLDKTKVVGNSIGTTGDQLIVPTGDDTLVKTINSNLVKEARCEKTLGTSKNKLQGSAVNFDEKNISVKRRKVEEILKNAHKRQNLRSPLPPNPAENLSVESSSCHSSTSTHEEDLCQSLDDEVQRTLQSFPSFIKRTSQIRNKTLHNDKTSNMLSLQNSSYSSTYASLCYSQDSSKRCISCNLDGKFHPMFSLPCCHLFCRKCLITCKNVCCSCDKPFSNADVVCVHNG